ncbi:MAG: molybdopterin-dependent oxidoreductase [Burkholderiaceae bacterium]
MTTPTVPSASRPISFDDRTKQSIEYTTCYMCACRCGIKVTLDEHKKVRFIQGTVEHPVNQGVLCAKGSAGIMKQYSPGKLQQPLRRKAGAERGSGQFEPISWDEALEELTGRLRRIRETDPRKLAFFTGRDQMQALTGLWAQQFGTPNWAAHGGFCSVNIAAAGLYSIGYSFWEFGAPDWDRARYFILWGWPKTTRPTRSRSAWKSSRAAARSSCRSTRCAPATRRSPTNGCRSARAPTACWRWRSCTCC